MKLRTAPVAAVLFLALSVAASAAAPILPPGLGRAMTEQLDLAVNALSRQARPGQGALTSAQAHARNASQWYLRLLHADLSGASDAAVEQHQVDVAKALTRFGRLYELAQGTGATDIVKAIDVLLVETGCWLGCPLEGDPTSRVTCEVLGAVWQDNCVTFHIFCFNWSNGNSATVGYTNCTSSGKFELVAL